MTSIKKVGRIAALTGVLSCCPACLFLRTVSHADTARELAAEGKYQEAIASYERHIESRLKDKDKPADENPYFYYLLIGDTYLKLDDPNNAQRYFTLAKQNQVDTPFLSDRFRQLAYWYSDKRNYKEALHLLETHRALDEINFDYAIDEIHKAMIAAEDQNTPAK